MFDACLLCVAFFVAFNDERRVSLKLAAQSAQSRGGAGAIGASEAAGGNGRVAATPAVRFAVNYTTLDGSALAGVDYVHRKGTCTFDVHVHVQYSVCTEPESLE